MPRPKKRIPDLVHHKPTHQARVRIEGQDFYLGSFGTPQAEEAYRRLIAEWLATGILPSLVSSNNGSAEISINEFILACYKHAQRYYVGTDGQPTRELLGVANALGYLKNLYGFTPVSEFTPMRLITLRQQMIDEGWSRNYVNAQIGRIKRCFRWGTERGLVPPSIFHGLEAVSGLRKGRTEARETEAVKPVAETVVNATLPHLRRQIRDMVKLQLLCGCRPIEICLIRPCDVDRSGPVWEYRPQHHKTEHHGKERAIFIGPRGQRILNPYLENRPADAHCFSPMEAEAKRKAELRAKRKTRVQPSQFDRSSPEAECKPGDHYTTQSYRQAIHRGCEIAFGMPWKLRNVPKKPPKGEDAADWPAERKRRQEEAAAWRQEHCWGPNQLRHARATNIRKEYGIEASQTVLGHSDAQTTLIYAARDHEKAKQIMLEVG